MAQNTKYLLCIVFLLKKTLFWGKGFMKYIATLIIVVIAFSCELAKMSQSGHKLTTMDKQFLALDTTSGVHDFQIDFIDKQSWKLRAIFPKKDVQGSKILVIALHWAGGGETYKVFSECLVAPAFAKKNAIVLVPDAENDIWYSPKNEKRILKLIQLANKNWNIDSKKVIIMGYSNGGNGAWYFVEHYPELFQAAIPMASAYPINGQKIEVPLFVIHGVNDELFDINRTRLWVEEAQKENKKIVFKRIPGLSHFEACNYLPALKEAVEWLP